MKAYLDILQDVVDNGRHRGDRTNTGTLSIFDARFKHDMREGFPLITTKRTFLRGVFWELMGFLRNDLHMQVLVDENVKIWDGFRLQEPADVKIENSFARRLMALSSKLGDALPVTNMEGLEELMVKEGIPTHKIVDILPVGALNAPYGSGWRAFKTANGPVDQFSYALDLLRHNPESRRILVSAWNPGWMPEETRQVPLTFDERYALFAKDHPDAYEQCETLMSYPEYQGDLDAAVHQMDEADVPVYKTVKVTPQDNIANDKPCLTPCHWAFEFYTEEMTTDERVSWLRKNDFKGWSRWNHQLGMDIDEDDLLDDIGAPTRYLSLKWHQRSCDMFLGVPFNIASYALLLMMVAEEVGMVPYMLVGDLTNVHIYSNHLEQVKLQLTREPHPLPKVSFKRKPERIEDYKWEDVLLENYEYHPAIKGDIAV